jgi:PTS system nitrogen regulatory IIA component
MEIRELLSIERVVPRIKARYKRDVLRKLAGHVGDTSVSMPALIRILESVELPVLSLGEGVSLLHVFIPGLNGPIAVFAGLEPALDFGAADGSNTDLIALLLSPAQSTGDHLRALACVARTLRESDVQESLRATNDRDRMYTVLCESSMSRAQRVVEL